MIKTTTRVQVVVEVVETILGSEQMTIGDVYKSAGEHAVRAVHRLSDFNIVGEPKVLAVLTGEIT